MSRAVRLLSKGEEVDEHTINHAASQAGIEPEQARERLGAIRDAFEGQAMDTITELGLNPAEVFSWAYAERPKQMQMAIQEHTGFRQIEGYKEIAKDYVMNLDTMRPDEIVAALPAEMNPKIIKQNGKSKVIFDTPVGQISWATAVRMGMVSGVREA